MMKHKGDWLLLLAAFIGGRRLYQPAKISFWIGGYDPFQVIFGAFSDGIRLHVSGLLQTAETNYQRGMEGRQYFGGHCLRQCFF